jgi:MFS family permease
VSKSSIATGANPYQPTGEDSGHDDGRESQGSSGEGEALPLHRDRAFIGMTITQFLGAFNDNVFKFLIIFAVLTTMQAPQVAAFYQTMANMLFAAPFILFSGYAGVLSDRNPKRSIIIASKVAEVVLMILGTLAFLTGSIWPLLVMLFLMGLQTTFFSPAKYGILPEMMRERDLPMVNGVISMTTFLAIIFGTVVGGAASELARVQFGGRYWAMNLVCVTIAIAGTISSLFLRSSPAANPGLKFGAKDVLIAADTAVVLKLDRKLLRALLVNAVFWFLAGVVQPTINEFGVKQLGLGETATSLLNGVLGLGIAAGFSLAGFVSRGRIRFSLLPWGIAGLTTSLLAVALLSHWMEGNARYTLLLLCFLVTGVSTGLFTLPLITYLQVRPPAAHKGRVVGAMNLLSWVGILLAALFYYGASVALASLGLEVAWTFAIVAALMVPLAFLLGTDDQPLEASGA